MSEIKSFLASKVVHDQKSLPPEYLPIFSRIPGAYQFDTLINKGAMERSSSVSMKPVPPYYLIFININTRKGYAYPMPTKNSKSVLQALEQFVSETNGQRIRRIPRASGKAWGRSPSLESPERSAISTPKVLRSDQDSAYLSNEIRTYLKDNNIGYTTTNDEDHNTLGIINRFIRTIRDLAGEKALTEKRMQKLITSYNNSVHSSTGKTPNEMNESDEQEYIDKKIQETDAIMKRRKKYSDGTKVRIKNAPKGLDKKRSNVTPEAYTIEGREGNQYLIKSIDGSIDKVPYFKIVPVKKSAPIKMAETIKQGKRGIVEKILGYDAKTDKYRVVYDEGTKDKIPAKSLRENEPLRLSFMERQYWVKKGNPPLAIKKWI
jgi:hypothetical protein